MWKTAYILLAIILIVNNAFTQKKEKPEDRYFPVTITFQNRVDSQLLSLDSTYINPAGETFQVRNFRYYIKGFSITENTKDDLYKTCYLPVYLLIDERKPESKSITVQVPFEKIKAIQFTVGVDSSKNVSGVQTGALDPANGMFWTWNSGYIFAKLEGVSPQSKAPGHNFTYHIGGFRTGENANRTIQLPVSKKLFATGPNTIAVVANVNAWFGNNLKIAALPSVMQPGQQALQIADNYSKMFSVLP